MTTAVATEAAAVTALTYPESQYTGCQTNQAFLKWVRRQVALKRSKASKTQ